MYSPVVGPAASQLRLVVLGLSDGHPALDCEENMELKLPDLPVFARDVKEELDLSPPLVGG